MYCSHLPWGASKEATAVFPNHEGIRMYYAALENRWPAHGKNRCVI